MDQSLSPIRFLAYRLAGAFALTPEDIASLEAMVGPPSKLKRGDILLQRGDHAANIWILGEGWAFRQRLLKNGRRQIVALMLPGELSEAGPQLPFGAPEMIVAATDLTVHAIERTKLLERLKRSPSLLQSFFFDEIARHSVTREWVTLLGRRKAHERLAYFIFETYRRLDALGLVAGTTFRFAISQQDVAAIVGLSDVHLNRTLQELRARGLLQWDGKMMKILDAPTLSELAQFNPDFTEIVDRTA